MRSADYLSAGKTTIDGGKITANSITAAQIDASELNVDAANITGKLTATQIDTSGLAAESIVVMNEEETKPLFSANSATNTVLIDGTVITGVLESSNFAYTSGNYSSAGTSLNLANGVIITPQFAIDSSGNAYFKGTIYSDNICNNVNSDATSFGEIIFSGGTSSVGQYYMRITDANDVMQDAAVAVSYVAGVMQASLMVTNKIDGIYTTTGLQLIGGDILLSGQDMIVAVKNTYYNYDVVFEGNVAIGVVYPNLANTLSNFNARISALEGGCGACQACQSCDTCQGCDDCDVCDACDTCQSCDTCQTCQSCDTCQSGDEPEYDYYVGDTFKVYFDQDGSLYLDLDGFAIDEYDSDGVYLLCVREGWCSYQLMASASSEPAGELVELYIGPDPNPCDSCDSYWDGSDWVN